MKKFALVFGIVTCVVLAAFAASKTGIIGGFLQSDMNMNGFSLTNGLNIVANPYGDGSHLSNVTATASGSAGGVLGGAYPNPTFGTFSSSTLSGAVSDETGSGSLVFGTSPTFSGQPVFGGQTATTILGLNGGKGLVSAALSGLTWDGTTLTVTGGGGGGASNAFNVTQFSSNNNIISIQSAALITNPVIQGTASMSAMTISNAGGGNAVRMLGLDNANNVVTNPVPTGGSVAAGVDILVSGSTVNFNTSATNIASLSLTNGSSIGSTGANLNVVVTNANQPLAVITNSTSGSAFTLDTNGLPITQRTGETNGFVTVINALNFGLRTGVDGTAAIQAAIDAATNAGQSVYIPHAPGAGNAWTVNGTLHAGRNRIFGDSTQAGVFGTILFHNANNGAIIDISNGYSNGGTGVEIDHITFLGNGTGNGFGITATNISSGVGAQNFSIHDCTFQALQEGIVLWRSWDIVLQNNYFQNVLKCYDFSNAVNGVTIIGGHLTGPANSYGLYVQGGSCYQITVVGSVFELLSNAVFTTSTAESVDIHGCYFEGNTNPIVMNGNNSPVISGCVFIQGSGSTTTNIIMVGASQPTIIGNDFFDTPAAWNIDSTSTGVSLHNNRQNPTAKANSKIAASTWMSYDGTNVVNTGGSYYGTGQSLTNLTYQYTTNRNGATTLTFGTAYWTNIAANLTISALTVANPAFYESGVLWVTNSSASDRTITWPSGVIGPVGTGTPSVMTATNKTITRFVYEHFGPNEITVTKTDFGP